MFRAATLQPQTPTQIAHFILTITITITITITVITPPSPRRRGLAGAPAPEDLAVELRKSLTLPKSLQVC